MAYEGRTMRIGLGAAVVLAVVAGVRAQAQVNPPKQSLNGAPAVVAQVNPPKQSLNGAPAVVAQVNPPKQSLNGAPAVVAQVNPPKQSLNGAPAVVAQVNPPKQSLNGAPGVVAAQAGRQALYKYLDGIAAKDEAARRRRLRRSRRGTQAVIRQQEVRMKIRALMGGGFQKTPLNAKVVGSTQMDGFRIEKVLYESQPKFYVTALLYVPDHPAQAESGSTPANQFAGDPGGTGHPGWR